MPDRGNEQPTPTPDPENIHVPQSELELEEARRKYTQIFLELKFIARIQRYLEQSPQTMTADKVQTTISSLLQGDTEIQRVKKDLQSMQFDTSRLDQLAARWVAFSQSLPASPTVEKSNEFTLRDALREVSQFIEKMLTDEHRDARELFRFMEVMETNNPGRILARLNTYETDPTKLSPASLKEILYQRQVSYLQNPDSPESQLLRLRSGYFRKIETFLVDEYGLMKRNKK